MAKVKKAVAKKAATKKATAKKLVAKKAAPKKAAAKKTSPKKSVTRKNTSSKISAPWAYIGTDPTPGVKLFAESRNNSWAALAVWLSMTTNPKFLPSTFGATVPDGKTAELASALGITENCVDFIRNIAVDGTNQKLYNAFKTVANAFIQIGFGVASDPVQPLDPPPYPPKQCLLIDDIAKRMTWVKKVKPVTVIVPAG